MKTYYIKKIVLSVVFCFSLFSIYAQTIDVIYLKNGFDARGTITEHGDSIVTLRTDSGKTLSIKTNEIESVSQEEATFNPKVLIGRWACYKANGERDKTYDIVISENEGL